PTPPTSLPYRRTTHRSLPHATPAQRVPAALTRKERYVRKKRYVERTATLRSRFTPSWRPQGDPPTGLETPTTSNRWQRSVAVFTPSWRPQGDLPTDQKEPFATSRSQPATAIGQGTTNPWLADRDVQWWPWTVFTPSWRPQGQGHETGLFPLGTVGV